MGARPEGDGMRFFGRSSNPSPRRRPPKCFPLFSALRVDSPDTIILLIVDYHAAIVASPVVPPAYALDDDDDTSGPVLSELQQTHHVTAFFQANLGLAGCQLDFPSSDTLASRPDIKWSDASSCSGVPVDEERIRPSELYMVGIRQGIRS